MALVELEGLADAAVGVPGQWGLSQEQRKRLTIAVELVANPSIVFMDEPTTGLDARAASLVMSTVRATASTGRTGKHRGRTFCFRCAAPPPRVGWQCGSSSARFSLHAAA